MKAKVFVCALLAALLLFAQTTVNGGRVFTGLVDMAAATYLRIPVASGAPSAGDCDSAGERGKLFTRSDTSATYICDGSSWVQFGSLSAAGGDLTGTYPNPTLASSGVSPGTYGSSSAIPVLTIDTKGRITVATTTTPPGYDVHDSTALLLAEDFIGGTTTTGSIGSTGMKGSGLVSATFGMGNVGSLSVNHRPGILSCSTTASTGSGCGFAMSNTATTANFNSGTISAAAVEWELQLILNIPSTADVRVRFGWMNAESALVPTSGFFLRYDTNSSFDDETDTGGAARWVAQMCTACTNDTGGSTNRNASTATVPTTGYHRLKLRKSGTTYYAMVDNDAEVTFCASGCTTTADPMPSNTGWSPTVTVGTDTTTAIVYYLDRLSVSMSGLTRF